MLGLPRGMRDIGPSESAGIEAVREAFFSTARLFGFETVDPSPIESVRTLELKSGESVRDEIYAFRDRGGREVGLRFDFTVGLARRAAGLRSERLPARLASFGGVWRYDEPQAGRYRYFHQWNVETFGEQSAESEADVVEFAARLLSRLGVDARIHLSHRELAEALLRRECERAGAEPAGRLLADSLRLVDKSRKRPRAELLAEYSWMPAGYAEALLGLASARGTPDEVDAAAGASRLPGWEGLLGLWESLRGRGVGGVLVDLGIVRGLDYYSGSVFEAYAAAGGDAIAGGGRYDRLAAAFGRPDLGAAGMAGGVERTAAAMPAPPAPPPPVPVLHVGAEMAPHAARLASALRAAGIPAASGPPGRSFRKQLSAAASADPAPEFAVIAAPREHGAGAALVRHMREGRQEEVPAGDVPVRLRELLGRTPSSAS